MLYSKNDLTSQMKMHNRLKRMGAIGKTEEVLFNLLATTSKFTRKIRLFDFNLLARKQNSLINISHKVRSQYSLIGLNIAKKS